jgi:hypothetical protein
MTEALIAAIIFLVGVIFAAGGRLSSIRKELAQSKLDINRMGSKNRDEEKAAARRYHNICMVIIANEERREDRFKIAGLLKED